MINIDEINDKELKVTFKYTAQYAHRPWLASNEKNINYKGIIT